MRQYRQNHGNDARHLKSGQTRFFVLSIWFVSTVLLKNSKSPHGFHALLNKYSHEQGHHLTFHTDSHMRHGRDGMALNFDAEPMPHDGEVLSFPVDTLQRSAIFYKVRFVAQPGQNILKDNRGEPARFKWTVIQVDQQPAYKQNDYMNCRTRLVQHVDT